MKTKTFIGLNTAKNCYITMFLNNEMEFSADLDYCRRLIAVKDDRLDSELVGYDVRAIANGIPEIYIYCKKQCKQH